MALSKRDKDLIVRHRIGEVILDRLPGVNGVLSLLIPDNEVKKVIVGGAIENVVKEVAKGARKKRGK